eukprot:8838027-Pyramimonas_sp.AAC.1
MGASAAETAATSTSWHLSPKNLTPARSTAGSISTTSTWRAGIGVRSDLRQLAPQPEVLARRGERGGPIGRGERVYTRREDARGYAVVHNTGDTVAGLEGDTEGEGDDRGRF